MSLESDDDLEIVGYFAGDGCQASMRPRRLEAGKKRKWQSRLTRDRACWGASPRNAETADMLGCEMMRASFKAIFRGPAKMERG